MEAAQSLDRDTVEPYGAPVAKDCPPGQRGLSHTLVGHGMNFDPHSGKLCWPLCFQVVERCPHHMSELVPTPGAPARNRAKKR